jgi:hypothetical protein
MKNLKQVMMMIMMKAKKILRPATKMRKIMTMMSRNVTGIHTAQLVTMHMSYAQ